jgi:hypothetical protein
MSGRRHKGVRWPVIDVGILRFPVSVRGIQQPSLTTLVNLAEALGVKPEMLIARAKRRRSPTKTLSSVMGTL